MVDTYTRSMLRKAIIPNLSCSRAGLRSYASKPPIFTATAKAVGGRHGTIISDDAVLDIKLAIPKQMGGKGGATNPEQLFAGGYAACFESAVLFTANKQRKRVLPEDAVEVENSVSLVSNEKGQFNIAVHMKVLIEGLSQKEAEDLVAEADLTCPYSNAIRGNVDKKLEVIVR